MDTSFLQWVLQAFSYSLKENAGPAQEFLWHEFPAAPSQGSPSSCSTKIMKQICKDADITPDE